MRLIEPLKKGFSLLRGLRARQVIHFVNMMINLRVAVGVGDSRLIITDRNATLVIGQKLLKTFDQGEDATEGNAPFEILTPNAGTATWNTIQVNEGITMVKVLLDGAQQGTPFGGESLPGRYALAGANSNVTIPIPGGLTTYYVWGGFDPSGNGGNGRVTLYVGTSAAGALPAADPITWFNFGYEDSYHFIIGAVTLDPTAETVTVIQVKDSNVTLAYEEPGWRALVFHGLYFASGITYVVNRSIVLGTAPDFPSTALWIYDGSGLSSGPGSNWTKFADRT